MTISFSCSKCGKHLRAPKGAAGRKSRCPDCGNVAPIPVAGAPQVASVSPSNVGVPRTKPSPRGEAATTMPPPLPRAQHKPLKNTKTASKKRATTESDRLVKTMIWGSCGALLFCIVVAYSASSWKKHVAGNRLEALSAMVDQVTKESLELADQFDFDGALDALHKADEKVGASKVSDLDLENKVIATIFDVQSQKDDYDKKIRDGWIVFEGNLMPASDKEQILVERKRRAEEEERRIAAANRRRNEELRAQKEEEAKRQAAAEADERSWAAAWDAWSMKPVAEGVVSVIAYLHYFPAGAHGAEARSILPGGLEQLWAAHLVELMTQYEHYNNLKEQYDELFRQYWNMGAWDEAAKMKTQAVEYMEESSTRFSALLNMGFVPPNHMYIPDSSPAGVIRQLKQHVSEPEIRQWTESFVMRVTAALDKNTKQPAP